MPLYASPAFPAILFQNLGLFDRWLDSDRKLGIGAFCHSQLAITVIQDSDEGGRLVYYFCTKTSWSEVDLLSKTPLE